MIPQAFPTVLGLLQTPTTSMYCKRHKVPSEIQIAFLTRKSPFQEISEVLEMFSSTRRERELSESTLKINNTTIRRNKEHAQNAYKYQTLLH